MKVIVTTLHLSRAGGVTQLYANLKDHFKSDVEFFVTGSREDNEGKWTVFRRMMGDMWKFHRRLKEHDMQLVHLNPSLRAKAVIRDGMLLLLARLHGRPTLVFFHGWDDELERRIKKSFGPLFRAVYGKADAFVALGSFFADKLRRMGIEKPIHLLTTAVDESFRDLFDLEMKSHRREEDTFRLLFLTRIEKAKGVYETVDAYRIVREKHPNVRLTVAGDGAELKPLKEYVEKEGIVGVDFPGYVREEEKNGLFAESDAYILPSYDEGLPVSVLEAMAAGLPVITRPVGSLPEFFVEGKTGFMTESLDPQVFAELIEKLVEDRALCAEISRYSSDYATRRFMSSAVAEKLEEVYERVVEQSRL